MNIKMNNCPMIKKIINQKIKKIRIFMTLVKRLNNFHSQNIKLGIRNNKFKN